MTGLVTIWRSLAVAVEALIRARLRPTVETENELQIDAALSAAADDVAAACRERERVSYHAGPGR